jgi:alpha-tubulin suppressor-like RCC1 family protein
LTRQIAAGGFHTCAIVAADSSVACWGSNSDGQLGLGHTSGIEPPGKVQVEDTGCTSGAQSGCALSTIFLKATTIAASIGAGQLLGGSPLGGYHTVALDGSGQDWGWGNNNDLQVFPLAGQQVFAVRDPLFLPAPMFAKIAAGAYHTCMVRNPGLGVFCKGNNNNGQSGPKLAAVVPLTAMAVDVAAGGYHTCSVQPTLFANPPAATPPGGVIQCWGENADGQVNGTPGANVTIPVLVPGA